MAPSVPELAAKAPTVPFARVQTSGNAWDGTLSVTQITSFDVFDTVLVRAVTDPTSVFFMVGRRLSAAGLAVSAASFCTSRIEAERRCRQNSSAEEITLEGIYRELEFVLGWELGTGQEVERMELEAEAELMRPAPRAKDLITAARAEGRRVVFISDMYLPAAFIRQQLHRFDLMQEGDGFYVSSEEKLTKSSGRLFRRVLEQERVTPAEVVHVGDNVLGDIAVPKRLGIRADPVREGRPNRFESIMESFTSHTDGVAALFAGASRLTRLQGPANPERTAVLWESGAAVVGPILSAYVCWVLDRARRAGIRRLYFLSRDGFLLHKIAEKLAPTVGAEAELRYLYSSRQAWHLPAITDFGAAHLSWLLHSPDPSSVRQILARVELAPEEIGDELEANGFRRSCWESSLTPPELCRLGDLLLRADVAEIITIRAARRRPSVIAYLAQEGLLSDQKWAIVDLGWNGRIQSSLASLLRGEGCGPPQGYYFKLFQKPTNAGELTAYWADSSAGLGYVNANINVTMLEMFSSAGHDMTVGYAEKDGSLVPVFQPGARRLQTWGIDIVHKATVSFAENLAHNSKNRSLDCDLRPMILELSSQWWNRVDSRYARVWSEFPYDEGQAGKNLKAITSPYGWWDCLLAMKNGAPRSQKRVEWGEAASVLTPLQKRLILKLFRKINMARLVRLMQRFLNVSPLIEN